jgi:hypothetical protein
MICRLETTFTAASQPAPVTDRQLGHHQPITCCTSLMNISRKREKKEKKKRKKDFARA